MKDGKDIKRFGEDIAFGIQQTAACWATDFIDPFVSTWVQKRLGDKNHTGTLTHAMKGEVVGDSAAFFIFLAMQKWLPQPVQFLKKTALKHFDATYDRMAKSSLSAWAADHNVSRDSEQYRHKVEEWKQFQAGNFAKATVISLGSIISNVGVQKWSGNKNSLASITLSKTIGAGITMGVVLGSRLAFPQATRRLDREMDRRFITPAIRKVHSWVGVDSDDAMPSHTDKIESARDNFTAKGR